MKKLLGVGVAFAAALQVFSSSLAFASGVECVQYWIKDRQADGEFKVTVRDYFLNEICRTENSNYWLRQEQCKKQLVLDYLGDDGENNLEETIRIMRGSYTKFNEGRLRASLKVNPLKAVEELVSYLVSSDDVIQPLMGMSEHKAQSVYQYTRLKPMHEALPLVMHEGLQKRLSRFEGKAFKHARNAFVLSLAGGLTQDPNHVYNANLGIDGISHDFGGLKLWYSKNEMPVYSIYPVVIYQKGTEPKIVINYVDKKGVVKKHQIFDLEPVEMDFSFDSPDGKVHVSDRFALKCRLG
jgi:hypothetical protein